MTIKKILSVVWLILFSLTVEFMVVDFFGFGSNFEETIKNMALLDLSMLVSAISTWLAWISIIELTKKEKTNETNNTSN
jgi:spore maturation protein SpmA